MDRWIGRELELRNLVRELNALEGRAQRLEKDARQLGLNALAKLDARDWLVAATEARNTADTLGRWIAKVELDVKSASRGATGRSATRAPSVPGLAGTACDKASRLSKTVKSLGREIERLRRVATDQLNDPLRYGKAAGVGMPSAATFLSGAHGLFAAIVALLR